MQAVTSFACIRAFAILLAALSAGSTAPVASAAAQPSGAGFQSGFLRPTLAPTRASDAAKRAMQALEQTWQSLKKDGSGRIGMQSLTYVVRRVMLRSYGLAIVGLDAANMLSNSSTWASMTAIGWAPDRRYTLQDVADILVAMNTHLERSSAAHLQELYSVEGLQPSEEIDTAAMTRILERYFFELMIGPSSDTIALLRSNMSSATMFVENMTEMVQFVEGLIIAYQANYRDAVPTAHMWNPLKQTFTFLDALHLTGVIIRSFGPFWATECQLTKDRLTRLDFHQAGRVKLSDFHGAALDGEWRFSESKGYLQKLGALDESSYGQPSIIIPNYVQTISNCIATSDAFRVCCFDECEGYLATIEEAVGGPYGSPEQLIAIVEGITVDLDDGSPTISGALRAQLEEVAKRHGGQVPLHGRLFAQWLHYVLPRECPYPYKKGSVAAVPPTQFGVDCVASRAEMRQHASTNVTTNATHLQSKWMEQWDTEEEILAGDDLVAPWQAERFPGVWVGSALLAVSWIGFATSSRSPSTPVPKSLRPQPEGDLELPRV